MFENSLINQIRNGGVNPINSVEMEEVAMPEPTTFEVEGASCSISFVPSKKTAGKYFAVLTAVINGVTLSNRYATKSFGDEDIENAKNILTRSVKAINKILAYNVNINQQEDGRIVASFDWETYSAFKEECSFGEFLPEVPEETESENDSESEGEETSNDSLTCEINVKNADALEEYADLLEETWKETVENFAKDKLFKFTVSFGKEEINYISSENIGNDGTFVYFENNLTSDDYARKVADVKSISKSAIPSYETEMLKKVIFS